MYARCWQWQQSINGARLCLWEPLIFDPPSQIRPPLSDHQKIVTGGYVKDSYPETKCWCKSAYRGLLG